MSPDHEQLGYQFEKVKTVMMRENSDRETGHVRTVCVYLYRSEAADTKVLLLRRHPQRGPLWVGAGGKVEAGETWEQAASREVGEETGLDVEGLLVPLNCRYSFERGGHSFIEETFAARVPDGWEPVLDSIEHDGYSWLSIESAIEAIAWPENRAALVALARQFGLNHVD